VRPTFETFHAQRQDLQSTLRSALKLLRRLGSSRADQVAGLADRVRSDAFRVMVLGEFKRGKSTLVNALLGEQVMPASATPCTGVVTSLRWGKARRATVFFRSPLPDPLPPLTSKARAHLQIAAASPRPMEVPVSDIAPYIVIRDPIKDQSESVAETAFDHVELEWPSALCEKGVEVLDSPGLNEHRARTTITTSYLPQADAVLFVVSCQAPGSQSEMGFIERDLRGAGHQDFFVVCNRFDDIALEDRERFVAFARHKLAPTTSFAEKGIFFLSAQRALKARLEGNAELLQQSGLPQLEEALVELLSRRAKVKLEKPARALRRALQFAFNNEIPLYCRMLKHDSYSLTQQSRFAKTRLVDAQSQRNLIVESLRRRLEHLRDDVQKQGRQIIEKIAADLPKRAEEYQSQTTISSWDALRPKKQRQQTAKLVKEVAEHLSSAIEDRIATWRNSELTCFLQAKIGAIEDELAQPIDQLLAQLSKIRFELAGPPESLVRERLMMPRPERIFLQTADLHSIRDNTRALLDESEDSEKGVQSSVPQVAAGIGLVLLGVSAPSLLIGSLAVALGSTNMRASVALLLGLPHVAAAEKRTQVGEAMARQLLSQADEIASKMGAQVFETTKDLSKTIAATLDQEIRSVRDLVDAVVKEKRQGRARVRERVSELNVIAEKLHELDAHLAGFLTDSFSAPDLQGPFGLGNTNISTLSPESEGVLSTKLREGCISRHPSLALEGAIRPNANVTVQVDLAVGCNPNITSGDAAVIDFARSAEVPIHVKLIAPDLVFSDNSDEGIVLIRDGQDSHPFQARALVVPDLAGRTTIEIRALLFHQTRICGSVRRAFPLTGAPNTTLSTNSGILNIPAASAISNATSAEASTGNGGGSFFHLDPNAPLPNLLVIIYYDAARREMTWQARVTDEVSQKCRLPVRRCEKNIRLGRDATRYALELLETIAGQSPPYHYLSFQGIGQALWEKAPQFFHDIYFAMMDVFPRFSIQFLSDDLAIPWELMRPVRDGKGLDILAVRHPVGRWHLNYEGAMVHSLPAGKVATIAPDYNRCQEARFGKHRLQPLAAAQSEQQAFVADLSAIAVEGEKRAVLELLQKGEGSQVALVHFAGHGSVDRANCAVLHLQDADLRAIEVRRNEILLGQHRHPLVLLNACQSAGENLHVIGGFADALMYREFGGLIAPLFAVYDQEAMHVGLRFAREALRNGKDFASILSQIRQDYGPISPTFLSYVYYGDVTARFT
jgi:GTPase Era involved in 16S rRNA processing